MVSPEFEALSRQVLRPGLNVASGVYTAVDPRLTMRMNDRGEYEYRGLDESYDGPADSLLRVSAFGAASITEDEFAVRAYSPAAGASFHPIIGHYQGLYAGHVIEGSYREEGSSGGITTWLLCELLRTGAVDGVIHLGATPGEEALFGYRISRTEHDVRSNSKSRYYPGQLGDVLTEVAATTGRYALTAIPSFAYEVRLLQELSPEFRERIPYVIGLVCGHQKTANYARYLAWRAGIEPEALEYVDFRRKAEDQPANTYTTELHATVGGERVVRVFQQHELFGADWGLGLFKSNFSDFTEDVFNETADIVLGDAWLPQYTSDSAGTNIVITRHPELHRMLEQAQAEGRLHLDSLSESAILRSQQSLIRQNVEEVSARYRYVTESGGYAPNRRRSVSMSVSLLRRRIQIERYRMSQLSHTAWLEALASRDLAVFDARLSPSLRRYRQAQKLSKLMQLPRRAGARFRSRIMGSN